MSAQYAFTDEQKDALIGRHVEGQMGRIHGKRGLIARAEPSGKGWVLIVEYEGGSLRHDRRDFSNWWRLVDGRGVGE